MIRTTVAIAAIVAIGAIRAAPVYAQRAPARLAAAQDTMRIERGGWSLIRVAKWSTALTSASVVAYGFVQNRDADHEYEEIELMCQANEIACLTKPNSDEYADPALEARYNAILRRDDCAQLALLVGQVGLAASVLLFIIDLPKGTGTNDIPYDPSPLRLGMRAEQLELGVYLPIR